MVLCSRGTALFFFLLIVAVEGHALDRHVVRAMPSKLQEDGNLLPDEGWKTGFMSGSQPKRELLNTKGSMRDELQGSSLLVQAMQEQIQSAKKIANLERLNKHPRLLRELRYQIKQNERALGASAVDAQLPKSAPEKIRALRQVLSRATERPHNKCEDVTKRLRSSVMVTEDKVSALEEENKNLGRLAVRTMPKGFHCLALQLTIQFYDHLGEGPVFQDQTKIDNSGLMHYVIYTENILAATVIINSTVYTAKEPHRQVFHVLTDGLNYAAMRMWFQRNNPDKATVEVENLEKLNLSRTSLGLHGFSGKYLKLPMVKAQLKQEEGVDMMKRLGLYYELPRIFPRLEKVLVLDDDIVVRKDLSHLWEEDLHKKVIGAVGSCETSNNFGGTLGWACMNMVDLGEWRRQGLSETLTVELDIWDGLTVLRESNSHVWDESVCHVIDLDDALSEFANGAQEAAAVHYRGYAKPWLGMGMNRHRSLWTRFVNYENPILQACNIHK
ncbi:hypothetical protein GOP47_0019398 [Adiantum capillus-veneris]|uniref:Hexosyltransferase n=1 Tax=Adiantum capillus-veneris TaxID=13818 RepID=A0A9D4Z712_ADICA|nr:hypothetical protein GOP47_0019398 [Adiantum capillus-veneris]